MLLRPSAAAPPLLQRSISFPLNPLSSTSHLKVIPVATAIVQDLAAARDDDHGVKTLKKDLLASMKKRMSFEKSELYAVATLLHPKYKRTMFQDRDNAEAAVMALRRLVADEVARSGSVARTSSSSASSSSGASVPKSFQDKMRRLRYGAMMLRSA